LEFLYKYGITKVSYDNKKRLISKRSLLFGFEAIKTKVDYNRRSKAPVGDAGSLRPRRTRKVGMLKPRWLVVMHE